MDYNGHQREGLPTRKLFEDYMQWRYGTSYSGGGGMRYIPPKFRYHDFKKYKEIHGITDEFQEWKQMKQQQQFRKQIKQFKQQHQLKQQQQLKQQHPSQRSHHDKVGSVRDGVAYDRDKVGSDRDGVAYDRDKVGSDRDGVAYDRDNNNNNIILG